MVFEFPELQGTIGGIYAHPEGLPEQVWKAIYDQDLPIGVEADAPPTQRAARPSAVTWAAVSLADKVDTFALLVRRGGESDRLPRPVRLSPPGAQGAVRILMICPPHLFFEQGDIGSADLADRRRATRLWRRRKRTRCAPGILPRAGALRRWSSAAFGSGRTGRRRRRPTSAPLRARRVAEALQGMRASEDFQGLAVLFKRRKTSPFELPGSGTSSRARQAQAEPAERALPEPIDATRALRSTRGQPRDYSRRIL